VLKICSILADDEQVVNKIINTFISLSLTVLFRYLHTFHHFKTDKAAARGSLEDTGTDQHSQCWARLNPNEN